MLTLTNRICNITATSVSGAYRSDWLQDLPSLSRALPKYLHSLSCYCSTSDLSHIHICERVESTAFPIASRSQPCATKFSALFASQPVLLYPLRAAIWESCLKVVTARDSNAPISTVGCARKSTFTLKASNAPQSVCFAEV